MTLYAIILNEPDEGTWSKVRETWPKNHVLDDRVAFIDTENALTSDIARDAGIDEGGANGLVIQMDYFAGHTRTSLVEWISKRG